MMSPDLTRNQLGAVAFALCIIFAMAGIQAASLGLFAINPGSDGTVDSGNTTNPGVPNPIRQYNKPATFNCTNIPDRRKATGSRVSPPTNTTSRTSLPPRHLPQALGANATGPGVRTRPSTASNSTNATRRYVPQRLRETCRLIERFEPPEWVTDLAATGRAVDAEPTTDGPASSLAAYSNRSDRAAAHLTLARDLRDILTDEARLRRGATFAAAELALAQRKKQLADRHVTVSSLSTPVVQRLKQRNISADDQLNVGVGPQLAAQQTKLQGARTLLTTAEPESTGTKNSLATTTRLTETGFRVQVARLQTDSQPTDPGNVGLPTTTPPDHHTVVAATTAILEAHDAKLTDEQAAELHKLDTLPESRRHELTDVLNAYLGYYRTVQATDGTDVQRVRAAQLRLLREAADLEAALDDSAARDSDGSGSEGRKRPTVRIEGLVSIDLSRSATTYTEDYQFQLDVGGDDTYNNNAGGANASGNGTDVAAVIDLGGSDTYHGRNGGGLYRVTKASPSPPAKEKRLFLPKKGEAAGFLLDAGTGDDTYITSAHGSNGGGKRAIGLLVDAGGADTYNGSGQGTNGAGYRKGSGFLLDVGTAGDTYAATDKGVSNGGAGGGRGFLFDMGGNDTYLGSNGGGHLPVENNYLFPFPINCVTDPREDNFRDPACQAYYFFAPYPYPPESGGFMVDAGGSDTYKGANGGANRRGSGFLLDAGTGNDTYEGKNGAANVRAAGFLLDMGGADRYLADRRNTRNGAGVLFGAGFLMDGGIGDDTYNATTGGDPVARQWSQFGPGSLAANGGGWDGGNGFLVDSGGNDTYLAGSVGTNGGASSGEGGTPPALPNPKNLPTGFLLDVSGDDRYEAGRFGVNGGADRGIGLLYDNAGTDHYTEPFHRCIDCSDIPKGSVGAQVDSGGDGANGSRRTGQTEVLVVDDATEASSTECQGAEYQTIQPAVDAAEPGDTVRVCAGTYPGNVTLATRNVRIEAAAPGQVVLDGEHERRVGIALVAPQTSVTGVTATNFSVGFTAVGRATTVRNTESVNTGRGIIVAGVYSGGAFQALSVTPPGNDDENPTVIDENSVTEAKQGIVVAGTGNVKVFNNSVTDTQHAIAVSRGVGVTIRNNTVTGEGVSKSKHQGGITSARSWDITITGNRVTNFTAPADWQDKGAFQYGYGIQIRGEVRGKDASHTLRRNALADNKFNLLLKVPDTAYQHFTITPSNSVNGKPVVYLVGAVGATVGPGGIGNLTLNSSLSPGSTPTNPRAFEINDTPGYVACVRCSNVTVRDLDLSHNGHGVLFVKSRGVDVTNVTVNDTIHGLGLRGSPTNSALTDNTVRDTNIAINVVHNCDPRKRKFAQTYREITSGKFELCANPSVLVANNTVRQSGPGFDGVGGGEGIGGAIMVKGTGVTVRENVISHVQGAGINMRGNVELTSGGSGLFGTGIDPSQSSMVPSTVRNNAISDAKVGISVKDTEETTVATNTIRNANIGLFTLQNNGVTYRANLVTNTTTGMFVHWREVSLTARNNTFRQVRWGLDGWFLYGANPPRGPATHDFGTSNTVNGERILWLTGAVGRTIDAADVNMVVCIRCVDVTVRDMTLTDNSIGVMVWDSTGTRVTNVTMTDTFRAGAVIRGGENNTVQHSTIIGSSLPIWAYPIKTGESQVGRGTVGRGPSSISVDDTRNLRETVGPVRILNNRITVDNASWPGGMTWNSRPFWWGHYGIVLYEPTAATVSGNTLTDNRWGVFLQSGPLSDVRIVDNTITSPRQEQGLGRAGDYYGIIEATFGVRVSGGGSDSANSSLTIRNNTLTTGTDGLGMVVRNPGGEFPSTTVVNNDIQGYNIGLSVQKRSNTTSVSIRLNRFVGAQAASIAIRGAPAAETVEIHQNLLNPLRFGYGVKYRPGGGWGGHMTSGGSSDGHMTGHQSVNATCNRWAAPSGPTSPGFTLVDPITGESADGNGSAVSRSRMPGISNVHFHPWLGNSPGRTCDKTLVGTPTPTPIPTPTRTPWPTIGAGGGPGAGSGDGSGDGWGNGTGFGDSGGTGQRPGTAAGGGEANSTVTARLPATSTQTATPPPTTTPEIVPGFGAGLWLIAFALVVGLLFGARRQD